MGDLKGHVLPGSFFILYGLWWAVGSIRRYFTSRRTGAKYISTATFPCPFACGRIGSWPVEGAAKVFLSSTGMLAEIFFNLPHPSMGIVQHATMYFFFMLSGVVDIILYLGVPLPPGTDYASVAMAFLVEGLLFANHLHERKVLDVKIHLLLVYVIFLTVVMVILEAKFQRSVLLTLSRAFLLILQGSWFWAVGIILYGHVDTSTSWNLTNNMDVMQATIYFSWHCATIFVLFVVLTSLMSCCYRGKDGSTFRNRMEFPLGRLNNGDKSEDYRVLRSEAGDEDSDIEFEKSVDKPALP